MSQKAEFGHVSPSKAVYSLSHSILLLGDEEEVIYNQEDPNEVDSDLDSLSEDSDDTPLPSPPPNTLPTRTNKRKANVNDHILPNTPPKFTKKRKADGNGHLPVTSPAKKKRAPQISRIHSHPDVNRYLAWLKELGDVQPLVEKILADIKTDGAFAGYHEGDKALNIGHHYASCIRHLVNEDIIPHLDYTAPDGTVVQFTMEFPTRLFHTIVATFTGIDATTTNLVGHRLKSIFKRFDNLKIARYDVNYYGKQNTIIIGLYPEDYIGPYFESTPTNQPPPASSLTSTLQNGQDTVELSPSLPVEEQLALASADVKRGCIHSGTIDLLLKLAGMSPRQDSGSRCYMVSPNFCVGGDVRQLVYPPVHDWTRFPQRYLIPIHRDEHWFVLDLDVSKPDTPSATVYDSQSTAASIRLPSGISRKIVNMLGQSNQLAGDKCDDMPSSNKLETLLEGDIPLGVCPQQQETEGGVLTFEIIHALYLGAKDLASVGTADPSERRSMLSQTLENAHWFWNSQPLG